MLTTLVTIAEMINYIVGFKDILAANDVRVQANLNSQNPRLWIALTFGATGFDLVLFWLSELTSTWKHRYS